MGASPDQSGITIPPGVLATLEAENAAAAAAGPSASAVQPAGNLPGGVAAFPVDQQTFLQISVPPYSGAASPPAVISLSVNTRTVNPDGTITNSQYTASFAPTAGLNNQYPMPPGYLMSVAVNCLTPNIVTGLLFCMVGAIHQASPGQPFDALFVADYLNSTNSLGWPFGVLHGLTDGAGFPLTVAPANPPAGTLLSYTVTDQYFMLTGVTNTLATAVAVANRQMLILALPPGGTYACLGMAAQIQTASLNLTYYWAAGLTPVGAAGAPYQLNPLAQSQMLPVNSVIYVTCANLQGADQIGGVVLSGRVWS